MPFLPPNNKEKKQKNLVTKSDNFKQLLNGGVEIQSLSLCVSAFLLAYLHEIPVILYRRVPSATCSDYDYTILHWTLNI